MFAYIELIVMAVTGLAVILVIWGTVAKNRWGISVAQMTCPGCVTPLARLRRPSSVRQALWGGYTCPSCHREIDKWGREIPR